MSACKTQARMMESPPAPRQQRMPSAAVPGASPSPVDSAALLQGHKTLEISHHGEIYRLQATRLGKLILTK